MTKHCIHAPETGTEEGNVDTAAREAVSESPRCNIWWFLLIAGSVIGLWLGALSVGYQALDKNGAKQEEQFNNILYRLDEMNKKLDKRMSGVKMMEQLASEGEGDKP